MKRILAFPDQTVCRSGLRITVDGAAMGDALERDCLGHALRDWQGRRALGPSEFFLMAIPGVGPVTALSSARRSTTPKRFRRSRDVAAYFGLTSSDGSRARRSTCRAATARPAIRRALYEAASAMLTRYKGKTALKSWGQKIAKRGLVAWRRVGTSFALWLRDYARRMNCA